MMTLCQAPTIPLYICVAGLAFSPITLAAQEAEEEGSSRTRVALGPQWVPSYPGADTHKVRPLIDVASADFGEEFAFEAPDESFGFSIYEKDGFAVGPSLGIEGKRSSDKVGGGLPDVGFSFEVGGSVQYAFSDEFRVRAEVRKGVSGHDGVIGLLSADFVIRDGDDKLFSIGPRLTLTDQTYQNAYFGVLPADSAPSGLPAFDASGGVQAVGGTIGYIQQLTPRWGIYSFANYNRLVGDPADSPVVAQFGSKDQFSGGVALTYTFGRGVR